jgi:atypical dual specificity phosphatase
VLLLFFCALIVAVLLYELRLKNRFALLAAGAIVLNAAVFFRNLVFEVMLIHHHVYNIFGYFDWYSIVDDRLYLGAVPMQSQTSSLIAKNGITAVLTVLEDFEVRGSTAIGRPMQPEDYESMKIQHLHLSCRDFTSPSFKLLNRGADFIDKYLTNGNRVYVHCKSGRGRSACMILAYFLKYRYLDLDTAYALLKKRRSIVFEKSHRNYKHMQEYATHLKGGGGDSSGGGGNSTIANKSD